MPPKTSSAAWPRRNPRRTTARKSIPTVAPTKSTPTVAPTKSTSNSAADSSPGTPPPSAATTTSPEPAPSLTSPNIATTPEYFPQTTPTFSARDAASKADSKSAPNETNLKNSEESRDPIPKKESVDEKASETAAIEASVPKSVGQSGQERKRTVVKKTVRLVKKVVKKVVKKKVPKRVQKGQPVSSSEDSGKMLVMNNENQNPYPRILGVVEIKNPDSVESDSLEVFNLKTEPIVSVSMEVEKKPNSSDIFVSMEDENPISEEPEDAAVGGKDTANGNLSEAPVADVVEAKTIKNEGDSTTETQLGDQNVGGVRNQNEEHETENVDSGGGEGGGAKEEVEEFDVGDLKREVGMGDGLVLRGEMEALERRKRRKTEIFVGGLDKDAKEEDIRTVFQEVGEIMEVRLVMKDNTGKNKGFAFVRYASASDAKKALTKFAKVEICGNQCGTVPVEGNDTIFLGNIDKKWKSEDIVKLLQEIGIEKIDKVTVVADPSNIECNRGFAFLEIETTRDAQIAYRKLQKKDVFGKHLKIKVAWAEPLSEPDEEEMLKVKSVYAEYLPSSWDEEKVKDYFKKFGDIENVVLARNLRSSKRKDFAFVKYASREAALACIEAFSLGSLNDEGSKVNVKVSLAKPLPKGKQIKHVSDPVSKELPEAKMKPAQPVIKPHQPRNKGENATSNYDDVGVDRRSSTTSELVQLLREQASWRQPQMGLGRGSVDKNYPYFSPGRKRPLSQLGDYTHYSDPRGYTHPRFESSFPATRPSHRELSQGIGMTSFPYNNHQQGAGYVPGSHYGAEDYPNSLQTRGGVPYHGSSGLHRRCIIMIINEANLLVLQYS